MRERSVDQAFSLQNALQFPERRFDLFTIERDVLKTGYV